MSLDAKELSGSPSSSFLSFITSICGRLGLFSWVGSYNQEKFSGDLVASLIVSVILIPQAMAYAALAGLNPVIGLYSSTLPLLVFSAFTTSSQVAVGPVAPTAILMESIVRGITPAPHGSAEFTSIHLSLALLTGLVQLALGAVGVGGRISSILSRPVMSGFSSGAACIIIVSQLPDAMGVRVPRESGFLQRIFRVLEAAPGVKWAPLLLAGLVLAALLFLKEKKKKEGGATTTTATATAAAVDGGSGSGVGAGGAILAVSSSSSSSPLPPLLSRLLALSPPPLFFRLLPLLVLLASIAASWAFDFQGSLGLQVVGPVPISLPPPSAPRLSWEVVRTLLPQAALLGLLNYVQTVSLSLLYGDRVGETIAPNRDLLGLGWASVVGSLFSGYTCAGSFTRTVVQADAGARTPATGAFVGLLMLLYILTIGRVFQFIPIAILAAIVLAATRSLLTIQVSDDGRTVMNGARPAELIQIGATFGAVCAFDIQNGLIIGVAVSFLVKALMPDAAGASAGVVLNTRGGKEAVLSEISAKEQPV